MIYETFKQDIIELHDDYQFLKYYKKNVVDDIRKNINVNNILQRRQIIKSLLNKQEYDRYTSILNKHLDLVNPTKGNFKPYGIVYYCNMENREVINKRDVIELISDDSDIIEEYLYELKSELRRRYLNNDY